MTILGIVALILLVIFGLMVLRLKGDPIEDESVRKDLAESKQTSDSGLLDGVFFDTTSNDDVHHDPNQHDHGSHHD